MLRPYFLHCFVGLVSFCALAAAVLGESQVNNEADFVQSHPDVALAAGGEMLVTWQSEDAQWGPESIEARVYGADGLPVGPQFRVDDSLVGIWPAAASLGGGKFVIAWQAGGRVIRAQIVDSTGALVGGAFDASWDGWPPLGYACVDVAAAADGRFAIAWVGFEGYVQVQRYAADATMVGSRLRLDPVSDEAHLCPALAFDGEGNFAVAWLVDELVPGGFVSSVYLQRFAANGTLRGARERVDDGSLTAFTAPAVVSSPGGDLLVAWAGDAGAIGTEKAMAQRYSGAGAAQGANFEVYSRGFAVDAAGDADGNVVVVIDTAGNLNGIVARRIAPDGSFIGPMSQVSNDFDQQISPAAAANAHGDFVAVWTAVTGNGQDPTVEDIVRSEAANIVGVFADGFESGDVSRWN